MQSGATEVEVSDKVEAEAARYGGRESGVAPRITVLFRPSLHSLWRVTLMKSWDNSSNWDWMCDISKKSSLQSKNHSLFKYPMQYSLFIARYIARIKKILRILGYLKMNFSLITRGKF